MKPEHFMFFSVVFFGALGTWTLCIQIRKIWAGKSAQSVSGSTVIVAVAFFAAFAVYGGIVDNLLTQYHGAWRALFWAPVAIGFVCYGKPTYRHLCLALLCLIMLMAMNLPVLRGPLLFTLTIMMIYFAWVQAYAIVVNKARGKVSLLNQIVPMTSASTWVAYGLAIGDKTLATTSFINTLSYLAIIAAWVKFPNPSEPQSQPTS